MGLNLYFFVVLSYNFLSQNTAKMCVIYWSGAIVFWLFPEWMIFN